MTVIIGSKNKTKIAAVKAVFESENVLGLDVPSGVSAQPIGDEETLTGAIHRAKQIQIDHKKAFAIGLEGGVSLIGERLYLCNWGALIAPSGKLFTASGARIELPQSFYEKIQAGLELSEIMDAYTHQKDIRSHAGAIGVFTHKLVDRTAMFIHVVKLLKGQYLYHQ